VRRPGWAGWLVGHTETREATVVTPVAHLRGQWLQVKAGTRPAVAFDAPVHAARIGRGPARWFPRARSHLALGSTRPVGRVTVAAAARSWELLPPPQTVTWFPALGHPQLLAAPGPGAPLAPGGALRLTFSEPVRDVLGGAQPRVVPATPGTWTAVDDHTLAFRPSGLGYGLGTDVSVVLAHPVHLAGVKGAALTRSVRWHVPQGSTLRLEQLLAQLGYLPLAWQPAADPPSSSVRAQLAAAVAPPPGQFTWRYPDTPAELTSQWQAGQWNQIVRGAVMTFQDEHDLAVDAIPGPIFWRHLLADAVAGKQRNDGYSYVFVHRNLPQSLNLWHNGAVILSSPGNTGVPAAPTQLGTFEVFEHVPVGTMAGTNPDGSHYNDPGIKWISYFHGGDAIHAFNRASFGTPQSLGCVELPEAAAAQVWPYTPIGTLVTIEN
jgi:hypothetical protein